MDTLSIMNASSLSTRRFIHSNIIYYSAILGFNTRTFCADALELMQIHSTSFSQGIGRCNWNDDSLHEGKPDSISSRCYVFIAEGIVFHLPLTDLLTTTLMQDGVRSVILEHIRIPSDHAQGRMLIFRRGTHLGTYSRHSVRCPQLRILFNTFNSTTNQEIGRMKQVSGISGSSSKHNANDHYIQIMENPTLPLSSNPPPPQAGRVVHHLF